MFFLHISSSASCLGTPQQLLSEQTSQKSLSCVNPLPNNKIVAVTKSKAFADNKFSVTKMTVSLYDRVENTGEKGENAGYLHFLFFRMSVFQSPLLSGS